MRTLLVTVDALRADHLGQFGYRRDTMPVLDRLETGAGTRYDATYANGTYTAISLPSLLSSRYFGQEPMRSGPNLMTVLRDAGVHTAGFHSNAMFASAVGEPVGFDHFEDFDIEETPTSPDPTGMERVYDRAVDVLRPIVEGIGLRGPAERIQEAVFPASMIHEPTVYADAGETTDAVLSHLDTLGDDWCCWVHYMDPHRPYGIAAGENTYGDPVSEDSIRKLMAKAGIHPESITEDERQRLIDLYDSDLRHTSNEIGRLFDGLIERGLWEDSAIVLTADHGEEFGEHGQYFHRNHPYDELLRIPLYVKPPTGPDAAAADGVLHDAETTVEIDARELLDIAPTICGLHGAEVPDRFEGELLAGGMPRRVIATGSFRANDHAIAGRWDGWKYLDIDGSEELYNLTEDPGEQDDLAADQPTRCEAYRSEIPEYVFDGETPDVDAITADGVQARLRDLGYLE